MLLRAMFLFCKIHLTLCHCLSVLIPPLYIAKHHIRPLSFRLFFFCNVFQYNELWTWTLHVIIAVPYLCLIITTTTTSTHSLSPSLPIMCWLVQHTVLTTCTKPWLLSSAKREFDHWQQPASRWLLPRVSYYTLRPPGWLHHLWALHEHVRVQSSHTHTHADMLSLTGGLTAIFGSCAAATNGEK